MSINTTVLQRLAKADSDRLRCGLVRIFGRQREISERDPAKIHQEEMRRNPADRHWGLFDQMDGRGILPRREPWPLTQCRTEQREEEESWSSEAA